MSWHRPKIKIKALGIKSKVFKDYGLVKKKKYKSSGLSSSSAKGFVRNPVSGLYDNPLSGKGVGWYG